MLESNHFVITGKDHIMFSDDGSATDSRDSNLFVISLGLYISREIVTFHGGFMKAKRKEQGLEVAIFLPV